MALAPAEREAGGRMSAHFRRGLVVGKFCPLHLGHELLIRQAQARCDEVLVLSYTKPGFEGYDRTRRANWLRTRFPDITSYVIDDPWLANRCKEQNVLLRELPIDDASEDEHRRFVAWLLREVFRAPVDSVFTSEDYGDGFAAVLSEELRTPVSHVCVDLERSAVAVSGTRVRQDPLACRNLLAPEVYADFVPRVALLGGESTGKTTLARDLAVALGTSWVAEYGRELWDRRDGVLAFEDMEHIARTQVLQELQQAQTARGVLICDTTPLTTLLYSEVMFGRATEALKELAHRSYALTLLCMPDFTFIQDGTRREAEFRAFQHDWYLNALEALGVEFAVLVGPIGQRIQTACTLIAALRGM